MKGMTHSSRLKIAFAWSGLPEYAARCIRAVMGRKGYEVAVVTTPPRVPIKGIERCLGRPIKSIDAVDATVSWKRLGLAPPAIFFQGGVNVASFCALGRDCRRAGGKVVLLSDRNSRVDWWRRAADKVRYRLLHRWQFKAILVPGGAGRRAALSAGWPEERIAEGLYGADSTLFNEGPPLKKRPKEFLFVGRFAREKNVVEMTRAFARVAEELRDWRLRLCGLGPEERRLVRHPQIVVEPFLQPVEVAQRMRSARCLVLASRYEPWGVVVHEAALSGCALILSDAVGALDDLATGDNAIVVRAGDVEELTFAFRTVAAWNDEQWQRAQTVSVGLATQFGPQRFADAFECLCRMLT